MLRSTSGTASKSNYVTKKHSHKQDKSTPGRNIKTADLVPEQNLTPCLLFCDGYASAVSDALPVCTVGGPQNANVAISEMEQLLQQIGDSKWQYSWLPTGAVHALVYCLAATILRPGGKFAQAIPYFCQAQQAIDQELKRHSIGTQVAASLCPVPLAQVIHAAPCAARFAAPTCSLAAMASFCKQYAPVKCVYAKLELVILSRPVSCCEQQA